MAASHPEAFTYSYKTGQHKFLMQQTSIYENITQTHGTGGNETTPEDKLVLQQIPSPDMMKVLDQLTGQPLTLELMPWPKTTG